MDLIRRPILLTLQPATGTLSIRQIPVGWVKAGQRVSLVVTREKMQLEHDHKGYSVQHGGTLSGTLAVILRSDQLKANGPAVKAHVMSSPHGNGVEIDSPPFGIPDGVYRPHAVRRNGLEGRLPSQTAHDMTQQGVSREVDETPRDTASVLDRTEEMTRRKAAYRDGYRAGVASERQRSYIVGAISALLVSLVFCLGLSIWFPT